jgi:ribosomal protein S18 acetylase RimI-like enzyme
LDWADRRAREILNTSYGRPAWFVPVFSELSYRRALLEEAGFEDQGDLGEDSWTKVLMSRSLPASLPVKPLPPGFVLRPLDGEREAEAYVELHRTVFESKSMTTEWRLRTLRQPEHRPDLDLVIEAPDKRLAAFCIGWFDSCGPGGVPCAQVEPLGVHPDFRGLGLAQAILSEALSRFHSSGARQAYVETDNYRDAAFQLYQSVGFQVFKDVRVYRKDFQK